MKYTPVKAAVKSYVAAAAALLQASAVAATGECASAGVGASVEGALPTSDTAAAPSAAGDVVRWAVRGSAAAGVGDLVALFPAATANTAVRLLARAPSDASSVVWSAGVLAVALFVFREFLKAWPVLGGPRHPHV